MKVTKANLVEDKIPSLDSKIREIPIELVQINDFLNV
jgi:hypothetical protein